MMERNRTSVLLVEDEPLWQEAIRMLLELSKRYELVAVADNFEDAMRQWKKTQPDIALLDWRIKGTRDGLAVGLALEAKGMKPGLMVVVSGSAKALLPANPYGYVPKARIAEDLLSHLDELVLITKQS